MARHEEHHENTGAYVLGALPELEAIAFERHLMGCDECRDELERLRPPAAALATAVPQAPAPASLKTSLMDAVRAESPSRRRSWRLPSFNLSLPRLHPATVSLSAAFLLAVGVLAGYGGFELTSDEGGSARTIAGTVDRSRTPDATATLVIPKGGGDPTLRVHGMPALPDGFLYEVWYDHGDRNTPAGTFTVAADGRGTAALPDGLEGVKRVMVTRERAPGARTPSLPGPLITVKT